MTIPFEKLKTRLLADLEVKAETMRTLWVPGVNDLGTYGRWQLAEFTDVFEIEKAFDHLIDDHVRVREPA